MPNELLLLRNYAGLTAADVAAELRSVFPKIDKTVISKAENAERYGVILCPKAMRLLRSQYPEAAQRAQNAARGRKADRHKKRRAVSVRLTESEYLRLQLYLSKQGLTAQEFFGKLVPTE